MKQTGKSVTDIAVLIALWSVFTIVFEVPSGVLAGRWNRRNMLAMAAVLQGLCFIIWFFSYTFLMFAIEFVFWAIAGAFASGTEEGLIYDNLKSDGCEESFTKVYGKAQFYANVGTIVGIASAGIIASFISIETIALISAAIVQEKISSIKQIFLLNGLACTFLTIFAVIWNQYVIVIFGLSFMIMAITEILLVNALQNEIKEEGRATVMSFYGIGQYVDDTPMNVTQKPDYGGDVPVIQASEQSSFSAYIRTHSNERSTLYTVNPQKDAQGCKRDAILPQFMGIISHDHEAESYKYDASMPHAERTCYVS